MTRSSPADSEAVLGVLGGLGPAATVSFMSEIIKQTPAMKDQDHIEMVVYNDPKVPDRNYPERRNGVDPLPRLIRNARRLEDAGAEVIVIASNTTHRYHDDIASAVDVPMPNMISLVRDEVQTSGAHTIGVITTTTAIEVGLFKDAFADSEIEIIYPDDMERVMNSIYAFKRGDEREAKRLMDGSVEELIEREVETIVLGCTEFSAMQWDWHTNYIDPATVLAKHCIEVVQDGTYS